jgi:hypothetical protein
MSSVTKEFIVQYKDWSGWKDMLCKPSDLEEANKIKRMQKRRFPDLDVRIVERVTAVRDCVL